MMRIAIVGAGSIGLCAARYLGEDARHATTVFETRAVRGDAPLVRYLSGLGVTLRGTAQVERLAVGQDDATLWIHGLPEHFDLALVTTSAVETQALLARSGIRRHVGCGSLGKRVYVAEPCTVAPEAAGHAGLVRIAADHPEVRPRPLAPSSRDARVGHALRALARRASGFTTARVEYVDLSGHVWPPDAPAIFIANQRWVLDIVPRHLGIRSLRTPGASVGTSAATTVDDLEAGASAAFVVEGGSLPRGRAVRAPHGRGAALASLRVNVPIVPLAADAPLTPAPRPHVGRSRPRAVVVIGEPFYPETSSVEELMDDMGMVLTHLEGLAIDYAERPRAAAIPTW
jgi:hypothetical protein